MPIFADAMTFRTRSKDLIANCGGVSFDELVAIARLAQGGAQMAELAADLSVAPGIATHLVDRLVKAGLVERSQSNSDRRVWNVRLTDNGIRVAAVAEAEWKKGEGK